MFEIEDVEKPAGTVVQVMEKGYVLNGRLLRPAKVVIAKGGPKAAAATDRAEEAETSADAAPQGPAALYEKGMESDKKAEATGSKLDKKL